MKKNNTFFIAFFLTCASLTLFAQGDVCITTPNPPPAASPTGIQCYTGCVAPFVKDGINTYSGVVRNTYNDGFSAFLLYNGSMSRWEIQFDDGVDFYNDADTAPNPPGFSVGTWVAGNGFCGAITAITGGVQNTPLPIELARFEGNKREGNNLLTWQTASETQNKGFDIERSTDGNRFQKIGFVAGKGTTTERQEYNFNDEAQAGISYYRLKQLDFDGRFEYSKIIAIAQNGNSAVSVFPNPSNGTFSITGIENLEDETFMLTNSVVQTLNLQVSDNGQFDISGLPSGLYYLRLASNGQVMKLIKE